MKSEKVFSPIWAEIDLNALVHNFKEIRRIVPAESQVMGIVKANAYGHGDVAVAHALASAGADALGVARLDEGVALREAGIRLPILILGYTAPEKANSLITYNLTQTVFSTSYALLLDTKAKEFGGRVKIHIKIDTGMGRLGLMPDTSLAVDGPGDSEIDQICREIKEICRLNNLESEGMFTHFAASDSADKANASCQLMLFQKIIDRMKTHGIDIPIIHAANSAAIIDMPEASFDMVRPGIILYGLYPSEEVDQKRLDLRPVMQIKARVAHVKKVPQGFSVSYGHTYITPRETSIATIPVGYADGYDRKLSSSGFMLVKGFRAPVIGRVCMDQTMIDVGSIPGVKPGDEVVIIGKQGEEVLSADAMAQQLGTINYEVVSTVMARVPRVYL